MEVPIGRAEQIAGNYRATALDLTAEGEDPDHQEQMWADVCGAVAFAVAVRNPGMSAYDVTAEAERLMMHLTIDDSVESRRTTRDIGCEGCAGTTLPDVNPDHYPRPQHGPKDFPPNAGDLGLRSDALATHMKRSHARVLADQLLINGYQLSRVSHDWLKDVHDGHHIGDI